MRPNRAVKCGACLGTRRKRRTQRLISSSISVSSGCPTCFLHLVMGVLFFPLSFPTSPQLSLWAQGKLSLVGEESCATIPTNETKWIWIWHLERWEPFGDQPWGLKPTQWWQKRELEGTSVSGGPICCSVAKSCPTLRNPHPPPSLGICPSSCLLYQWCHPTISSSVTPFSFRLESFLASWPFPVSRLVASGGQSIRASASVSAMSIQGWFPLGLIGLISLLSKGFFKNLLQHQFFSGLMELLK